MYEEFLPGPDFHPDELPLLSWYVEFAGRRDGAFFKYIGLPKDATCCDWRRHYDKDGLPDIDRAAEDYFNYPPIAARIKEDEIKMAEKAMDTKAK